MVFDVDEVECIVGVGYYCGEDLEGDFVVVEVVGKLVGV